MQALTEWLKKPNGAANGLAEEMVSLVPLAGERAESAVDADAPTLVLSVQDMHCSSCSTAVELALRALPCVSAASVALLSHSARVTLGPGSDAAACEAQVVEAVSSSGFACSVASRPPPLPRSGQPPDLVVAHLSVGGMSCGACSSAVEAALRAAPGVESASVSLAVGRAQVWHRQGCTTPAALARAVQGCGFECSALAGVEADTLCLRLESAACEAEAQLAERALRQVPGVERAWVEWPGRMRGPVPLEEEPPRASGGAPLAEPSAAPKTPLFKPGGTQGKKRPGKKKEIGSVSGPSSPARNLALVASLLWAAAAALGARALEAGRALPALFSRRAATAPPPAPRPAPALAYVRFDPQATGPRAFLRALRAAGLDAGLAPERSSTAEAAEAAAVESRAQRRLVLWGAALTAPVWALAMVCGRLASFHRLYAVRLAGVPLDLLLRWVLATPVQFWVGRRFHAGAWASLRARRANMDVLVSLGTNVSYFYSVFAVLRLAVRCGVGGGGEECGSRGRAFVPGLAAMGGLEPMGMAMPALAPVDFFETAAMLITLVLFGKWVESAAKGRTSDAISKLCALAPRAASVLSAARGAEEDGEEPADAPFLPLPPPDQVSEGHEEQDALLLTQGVFVDADTALLHRRDVLRVLPGARFPADGVVLAGRSHADESMLTGESAPVPKSRGAAVVGGTLNARGALVVRVERAGREGTLAQIVRLVEAAQLSKAPIQAFADAVSAVFVPCVVAAAVVAFCAWFALASGGALPEDYVPPGLTPFSFALVFGVAVVVIACPCALGLAAPTAIMVGTGVAAQHGVLLKGGAALQRAAEVDTVVFDKTGTLTVGAPSVVEVRALAPGLPVEALEALVRAAGALEKHSEHPLGAALVARALGGPGEGGAAECLSTLLPMQLELQPKPGMTSGSVASSSAMPSSASQAFSSQASASQASTSRASASRASASRASASRASASQASAAPLGLPLPPTRDVESVVGGGVRGWVELPPEAALGLRRAAQAAADGGARSPPSLSPSPPTSAWLSMAVGSARFAAEEGCAVPPSFEAYERDMAARGCTVVLLCAHGRALAAAAVADALRPEARGVVAALHLGGTRCVLLTGDAEPVARAVAEALGLGEVFAGVRPEGKVEVVQSLRAQGRCVAMVGDGVNDSPALAAADVGVAVGSGADVAVEAADVVLVRSSLEDVLAALDLARAALRRIRWNYAFALAYNAVMVPVAAGGLYPLTRTALPPWAAGACMALSSLSVLASSLRLRAWKRPPPVLRDTHVVRTSHGPDAAQRF